MNKLILTFVSLTLFAGLNVVNAQGINPTHKIAKTIRLQGDGSWDYLSVDEAGSRLYVSHGTQVNVVDLKKGEQIAVIPDTKGVHGIAIANDLNKAFISNGKDSSVTVIGLARFDMITKISISGKNPDAILYDPFTKRIFTFNGKSANCTVIDALQNREIGSIPLGGKPEFAQTDGEGNIYVNIEDKNDITCFDATTLKVKKSWSIAPGEGPSGLALDKVNHRLFSVCSNKLMIVSDAITGRQIARVPIGNGCDGVVFDPATRRIFSSNGEGNITVVQQESAENYKVIETIVTQPGARTITIDKTTHHLYVSTGEYLPGEGRRPIKPGTFVVLEIVPVK